MNVKWNNKNKPPSFLISDIRSHFSINDDGAVSKKSGVDFKVDALLSRVVHSYELDYSVLYQIFNNTITSVFEKSKLSKPDVILSTFKKECDKFLRIKKKYYLLTSISLSNSFLLKRRAINGCVVSFYRKIPNKYKKTRSRLMQGHTEQNFSEQENYVFVIISVVAPDVKTAFKNSIGALDVIRAILQLGFRKNIQFFTSRDEHRYPSDAILSLGRVHTLHLDDGSEATENIWHESNFKNKKAITIRNFHLTESSLTRWIKKLNNTSYSKHLLTTLASYISALDRDEQEFRFMKLWSVVEMLVQSDDTKMIIRRVSFFYANRDVTKEMLNSLRLARNVNVHAGVKPFNVEMKNFNLCVYIEELLRFFIDNPFKYNNLQKIIDFISLPTQLQSIDQQIKNLKTVKKYIEEG